MQTVRKLTVKRVGPLQVFVVSRCQMLRLADERGGRLEGGVINALALAPLCVVCPLWGGRLTLPEVIDRALPFYCLPSDGWHRRRRKARGCNGSRIYDLPSRARGSAVNPGRL